ncbi:glycoside hydrolase family 18 protein [Solidesulfovibrio fructosivorans]|nr:glycosyl hydrolase family 18 protein [Solidesulfovibrio fructosivorans]
MGQAGPTDRLTAWIAYWDLPRGMAEWRAHPGLFDTVRVFAASFDDKDRPYLAPEWDALFHGDVSRAFGRTPAFLTVVNDVVAAPSGKNARLKDPELVKRLVSTPAARTAHIGALVALAKRSRFSGLEIDYENIAADDWPAFLDFVRELYQRTSREGLALSVLLQPQARYLGKPLPVGPQYLLMGYNLFGSHSGPGPKATPAFLANQASALRAIGALSATGLALSTGGFDWTEGKSAVQLDETAAATLVARKKVPSTRSAPDGYLVSQYRDAEGKSHEIWHADAQTLSTLWQAARTAGFSRLAIWRLGGNAPGLFDWLQSLK